MSDGRPHLRVVPTPDNAPALPGDSAAGHELDWSILMARAQQGDGAAYRRLLEEVTPFLRVLCGRRHRDPRDIEDGVQEILVTLHRMRITYDPMRPFGPWLVAIANRRLIDQMRGKARRQGREQPLDPDHTEVADLAAAAEIDDATERQRLHAAISQLPEGQRQAIRLLKLDELSLKEASAASGLSIVALKVATHRALRSLRRIMTKGNDR